MPKPELTPLRTRADLDQAVAVIDSLIDRPKLSDAESDYLDVLSDLVEAYEALAVRSFTFGQPSSATKSITA